jgi:hypothetical protein
MCEVEIELETGSIQVVRYLAVDHVRTGGGREGDILDRRDRISDGPGRRNRRGAGQPVILAGFLLCSSLMA